MTELTATTDQELIDWFTAADLPKEPFELDQARRVLNPQGFYNAMRQEISNRRNSPRWRCGATQADLRRLRTVLN
ncbi:MAG TPA: hypothetical protein PLA72_10435 [Smithellaceae bacterium]|jgi:hypothetical protein|nr:hypothetical protein [Smithellaceae bacterium]